MGVNVRVGMMVLMMPIALTAPAIASAEDAISLKPSALFDEIDPIDMAPFAPLDEQPVRI